MTNMQGLYDTPWQGKNHPEQWAMLRQIVEEDVLFVGGQCRLIHGRQKGFYLC
jgi:hypothetical protein